MIRQPETIARVSQNPRCTNCGRKTRPLADSDGWVCPTCRLHLIPGLLEQDAPLLRERLGSFLRDCILVCLLLAIVVAGIIGSANLLGWLLAGGLPR